MCTVAHKNETRYLPFQFRPSILTVIPVACYWVACLGASFGYIYHRELNRRSKLIISINSTNMSGLEDGRSLNASR